jgi:hypothetical protein
MLNANPNPIVSETNRTGYKHYPEDPPGEELGEAARVWQIYGDEAREIDKDMIDEYKESIDILLVFVRSPLLHTTRSVMFMIALHRPVCSLPLQHPLSFKHTNPPKRITHK